MCSDWAKKKLSILNQLFVKHRFSPRYGPWKQYTSLWFIIETIMGLSTYISWFEVSNKIILEFDNMISAISEFQQSRDVNTSTTKYSVCRQLREPWREIIPVQPSVMRLFWVSVCADLSPFSHCPLSLRGRLRLLWLSPDSGWVQMIWSHAHLDTEAVDVLSSKQVQQQPWQVLFKELTGCFASLSNDMWPV